MARSGFEPELLWPKHRPSIREETKFRFETSKTKVDSHEYVAFFAQTRIHAPITPINAFNTQSDTLNHLVF